MEVLHERCAGLDVHKDIVVACARVRLEATVRHAKAEFATTTRGLLALVDWLEEQHCTHVAMEATGVYWKPVWHVLEGRFELLLVNPAHARNVPGRKSDVSDAHWLADLLAHGLIRPSFVPPEPIQELRDLTRTRKQLVRQVARHTLRIQKTLEDANLKITGVVSDLLGASGRAILRALIAGESDPERLLEHTTGRLRASRERLLDGLQGMVTEHHRFMLRLHLRQIEALEAGIAQLERQIARLLRPFRSRIEQLTTIPGVSDTVAQVLVAEIGMDMTRFPTPGHLVSWAGLCPRMDESAGKPRSTPRPTRCALAQDHAGECRLGRCFLARHLPARPVPAPQDPPWAQEGRGRRRRLDPDRGLLHPARWRPLPRSRSGLLRSSRPQRRRAPAQAPHRVARLSG